MAFDKEQYWAQRNAEKAFRKEWYIWRNESKNLWGANFVNANPSMFTQRAFVDYLRALDEAERKAQEAEAQLQLEAPTVEVAPLPKLSEETTEASGVLITDI